MKQKGNYKYILIIKDANLILKDDSTDNLRIFYEILNGAVKARSNENNIGLMEIPSIHIILQCKPRYEHKFSSMLTDLNIEYEII